MFFYQISTLTAGTDTHDHVGNGTVVKGIIGGGDKAETWGIVDTIAGGTAGSKMDLTAIVGDGTANPTGNVSTIGRSTSGIETFNITFKDADAVNDNSLTVDTSSLAGAKNFNIVSATASTGDKVKFDGLAQDQMVTIKSAATQLGVELNYSEAAKAGKEDVASFSLHNAKALEVVVDGGMEAVKITATGDNEVGKINANGATKFELSGAGSLDAELTGGAGNIAEINASTATGSLDLTVTTAHLNTTKATIKGGTATDDVLNVNGDINAKMTVSGFETVGLNGREHDSATPITFDMSVVTGATTVANFDNDSALTVKNATGVTNLLMEGLGDPKQTTTDMHIGGITFKTKDATAQDALAVAINNDGVELGNLTADSTKEAVIKAGALDINNVKNITINAADADVVLTSLAADKMESLTVNTKEDFAITNDVTFSNAAKVNMTGVVGDVTMSTGAMTTALTYTGSSAADTLHFGALTGADTKALDFKIDTGAGNDVVTLSGATGAKTAAVLTMTLGEGNDNLILDKTFTIDSSGVGQTINFGDGTGDSLTFDGTSNALDLSAATVTGLEELKLTAAATKQLTINDETANGLKIVHAYTDNTVLNVTMTKGNDLDVSGLILNGNGAKLNITGSANADKIIGSDYADTITGGKGADTMTGGKGADKFVLSGGADAVGIANVDHIMDFASDDEIVIDTTTLSAAGAFIKGLTVTSSSSFATLNAVVSNATSVANMTDVYTQLATSLPSLTELAASTASGGGMVARVVTFTTGEAKGSYLVINDGTAGFQADADIVINITGVTGAPVIAADDFSFI